MTDQAGPTGQSEGGTSALAATEPMAGKAIAPQDMGRDDGSSDGRARPGDTESGVATAEFRAEFAEESHKYIREHISLADQKAGFFFTVATALLAFLYQGHVSEYWMPKSVLSWNPLDICAFTSMAALSLAAICALYVLIPRLPGSRRGYVFWEAIAEYPAARQYSDDLAKLSAATFAQQKAEHCHELALVCRRKFRWLRLASQILAIGLVCSVVILLFGVPHPRQSTLVEPVKQIGSPDVTRPELQSANRHKRPDNRSAYHAESQSDLG